MKVKHVVQLTWISAAAAICLSGQLAPQGQSEVMSTKKEEPALEEEALAEAPRPAKVQGAAKRVLFEEEFGVIETRGAAKIAVDI